MSDEVLLTIENQVAIITFNRPKHLNAFNGEMAAKLEEITSELRDNSSIRAVLLKGAGDAFMAGQDIEEFYQSLNSMPAEIMPMIRQLNASILAFREMEVPVLASVHGIVMGPGLSIMLATDLTIAAEDTQFSLDYSMVGATPAGGITYGLPRIIGSKKAMEMFMLSDTFDANTAHNLSLVNWVVPHDSLAYETDHIMRRLATGPTWAYSQTKQLVNSSWQNRPAAQLELEAESFAKATTTQDFKQSVRALVGKQQPEFEGK